MTDITPGLIGLVIGLFMIIDSFYDTRGRSAKFMLGGLTLTLGVIYLWLHFTAQ